MTAPAANSQALVRISGRGALVNIHLDDSVPLNVACRGLREHLAGDRRLYSKGEVIVDIGRRILDHDQQDRIRRVIESESGLNINRFWCDVEVLERERQRIENLIAVHSGPTDHSVDDETGEQSRAPSGHPNGTAAHGHATLEGSAEGDRQPVPADVVRGTCRSGDVLRFPGNVVVVGNVNPGAQIIAQGDILVFGTLRGTAHAGAGGDPTAVIIAMAAASPQLRIADYTCDEESLGAIAGRRHSESDGVPTIARVRNRAIHVSRYLKNYAIDHGGNPNER